MVELNLEEDKRILYREQRMYSNILGKKILARIVKNLGYEVLYEFGFTNAIVERMIKKGILGGEVDILFGIRESRSMFQSKFVKQREWNLFRELLPIYRKHFNLKPLLMLSVQPISYLKRSFDIAKLGYEDMFFAKSTEKKRILLDRTVLFDALVFFICELNDQHKKLSQEQLTHILHHDFGLDIPTDSKPTPKGIYYDRFRKVLVDGGRKTCSFTVSKSREAYQMIPSLYAMVRKAFTEQGIGSIQDYLVDKTGAKVVKHWNHEFINFALHFKHRIYGMPVPNIFLGHRRDMCAGKIR